MSNLILVGFMCTGKTSVGERVARALGLRFVDCDEVIKARAGKAIADIFAAEGEAHFRRLEREVVGELARQDGQVIATGGGALGDPRNVEDLRASGEIIALRASPQAILERAEGDSSRPLLAVPDPRRQVEDLLARRAGQYAQADRTIDTTQLTVQQVVEQVLSWVRQVEVELGERSYCIHIGSGLLGQMGELVPGLGQASRLVVMTNPLLNRLYGGALRTALDLPTGAVIEVPPGERTKSLRWAGRLWRELARLGLDRKSLVVALGGGVIGDLAGFAAATYMRGIGYVQVPTTLLAQVDSSVGGKVGVNLPEGKNLVGAFWQPQAVVCDLETLRSLPPREVRTGLAEVVKHAVIADQGLFTYLERHAQALVRVKPTVMWHVVRRNCQIKARVVAADEQEQTGQRAILNFGHTFGHALETRVGYGRLKHGQAVAIGMALACRLAVRLGMLTAQEAERVGALLRQLGLRTEPPRGLSGPELLRAMRADKKAVRGELALVLPRRIGQVELVRGVPEELVAEAIGNG